MSEWEQKGYDSFIEWLMSDGAGDNTRFQIDHYNNKVKELSLELGTDERRNFTKGWLKARDEV